MSLFSDNKTWVYIRHSTILIGGMFWGFMDRYRKFIYKTSENI